MPEERGGRDTVKINFCYYMYLLRKVRFLPYGLCVLPIYPWSVLSSDI